MICQSVLFRSWTEYSNLLRQVSGKDYKILFDDGQTQINKSKELNRHHHFDLPL